MASPAAFVPLSSARSGLLRAPQFAGDGPGIGGLVSEGENTVLQAGGEHQIGAALVFGTIRVIQLAKSRRCHGLW